MAKPNKIAVLYSGGQSLGGIENYLIHLFGAVNKNDIDIELLSLGKWQLSERMKILSYNVKEFSQSRIRLKTIDEIGKYCIENEIKLLVSQGTVANAYARLVSKKYKITNLVTVHSDASSEYPNPVISIIYQLVDRFLRKYTDRYIAVSKYIKSVLVESGVPAKCISVVYNGVDCPKPGKRDHKRLVVGSMGRLNQVKGYDILIRAFAKLENKRLRLKIAGEGEELNNLKDLTKQLGVDSRVEFVGYKTDEFKFLDAIDVYVQPSRSEGFGIALVQAMSQNLPVVVTPAGSLKELVTDGQTGFISKEISAKSLATAMDRAIVNIELSTRIGENAGKFVSQNFSVKKWVDETSQIYDAAIGLTDKHNK